MFRPDVEISLKATQANVSVLPGSQTDFLTYRGELIQGDPSSLQGSEDTYLGPLIRVRKGQKVRVRFTNDLSEPTIIHWHGLLVPSSMDGHPRDAIQPGQTYVYEFEVVNRAGTYWYHPHPDLVTGGQAYCGLAGLFIVTDDEEATVGLPSGAYDVPLVIQDRAFDQDNQLVYLSKTDMPDMVGMDRLMGFLGDRILVNGQPDFVLDVATRSYRLRLLNGSNSRVYKLAWSDGAPLIVIATDGGLLERPVRRPYVTLGPGERVELWVDYRQRAVGSEVALQSLEFLGAEGDSLMGGESGGDGMSMGGDAASAGAGQGSAMPASYQPTLPNGAPFSVMTVRVARQEEDGSVLPAKLSTVARYTLGEAANGARPRRFRLSMRDSAWLINGRSFELEAVAEGEVVKLGSLEAWEFVNETNPDEPMEKMGMVHPMHIHGVQFQVMEREVWLPPLEAGWRSVAEGYVDEGWKDTVLIMPGERVKLMMRFRFAGLFVFHCHNLEHEDLGMMRNYRAEG
ncbi:MAG: multicopper oxidase family protein [Anaerolineae bacterium]